jgi:oxygen-independent coproporphyrinogen-3 oxidase
MVAGAGGFGLCRNGAEAGPREDLRERIEGMAEPAGIYISVPFCRAKCTYCNFASGVFGPERMDRYVERVCAEMKAARARVGGMGVELPGAVDSVFLGGGTPSLLGAEQLRRLFAALRGEFALTGDAEVTLECAPGQLGEETLGEMLRQGMNRISFGVQSFVDREAAAVGRLHTREMCLKEIARMRAAGVENINVDLIVGLPGQTAESWRASVSVALESGAPHVSMYMLEVDEDSRLGREVLADGAKYGAGTVPTEDETAEWYGAACEWLAAVGVRQYEISNFARDGRESRHNKKYWRRENYLGFGLDAHSMLRRGKGAVRWANTDDLDGYLAEGAEQAAGVAGLRVLQAAAEFDVVGKEQAFEEAIFLGLRMNEGVDLDALRGEFGEALVRDCVEALGDVKDAGLVECEGNRVWLTARGRMASNEVFSRLLVGTAV